MTAEPRAMKFRDYPLLTRRSGIRLWPPAWSNAYQDKKSWPVGEIGTLEKAWMHELLDRCVFLYIEHNGFRYTGSMYFDDPGSCLLVYNFFQSAVGRSIADIGDSDISYLL
jgi:hypothetical protein